MSDVRVRIDIAAGSIEVEAPADAYADVFDKVSEVLPRLVTAHGLSAEPAESDNAQETKGAETAAKNKRTKRSSGGSKESYKITDLGLTEEERVQLREFFQEKKPGAQHDQIAVLMAWLKKEKEKSQMKKDDVFTAFRTVDAKVPAKISAVLGNMVGLGWATNVGDGAYELTHVGEDHVKFDLPPKKKAN